MRSKIHPRRRFLATGAGLVAAVCMREVAAADGDLRALVRAYAGDGTVREGRVRFEIAPLVDNGNSVPITVSVESPMSATDRVVGIAIFNEKNPEHDVAKFTLSARSGTVRVSTRIRLAATQKLVAVAKMHDGSCWTHTVEVLVTLAACLED